MGKINLQRWLIAIVMCVLTFTALSLIVTDATDDYDTEIDDVRYGEMQNATNQTIHDFKGMTIAWQELTENEEGIAESSVGIGTAKSAFSLAKFTVVGPVNAVITTFRLVNIALNVIGINEIFQMIAGILILITAITLVLSIIFRWDI